MITNDNYEVEYTGNHSASTFAYDFKIYSQEEVRVVVWPQATMDGEGVPLNETVLTLNTHYTVADVLNDRGGTITLLPAPQGDTQFEWLTTGDPGGRLKTGYRLRIENNPDFTQAVSFGDQQRLNRRQIEDAFDKITTLLQEKFRDSLRWVGEWDITVQYAPGDVVTYVNPSNMHADHFIAVKGSRGVVPEGALPADAPAYATTDQDTGQIGNHWDSLVNQLLGGPFLPIAGGTLTGNAILPANLDDAPIRAAISKAFLTAQLRNYVRKVGDQITGPIEIDFTIDDSTPADSVVSKQWIEAQLAAHALTPHGGEGMGLNQSQVEMIIDGQVETWAEYQTLNVIPAAKIDRATTEIEDWVRTSNTDAIPAARINQADSGIMDWARLNNTDQIPANKLTLAAGGGSSLVLEHLSVDPPVANYQVGDMVNVNGEIRVLSTGASSNTIRGVGEDTTDDYIGVRSIPGMAHLGRITSLGFAGEFLWKQATGNDADFIAKLPVALTRVGTPGTYQARGTIYAQHVGANGETTDIVLTHNATYDISPDPDGPDDDGLNPTGYYGYTQSGNIETELAANVGFSVAFWTDSIGGTALIVTSVANHWGHEEVGETSAGVEAILDKEIPAARRIPAFDATNRDEYIRINNAGDGLETGDLPARVPATLDEVYNQAKDIVKGSGRLTVIANDTNKDITVSEGGVPSGAMLPAMPTQGELFTLTVDQDDVVHNPVGSWGDLTDTQRQVRGLGLPIGPGTAGGPLRIAAYSPQWEGATNAINTELRGKVFLVYNGSTVDTDKIPATLFLYRLGAASESKAVGNQVSVSGIRNHFEITGLTYAQLLGANTRSQLVDTSWHRNITYTGQNGKLYPDVDKPAGAYLYNNTTGWQFDPSSPASWARQGQSEPRTLLAVDEVQDSAGPGLTINANTMGAATYQAFAPVVDLDEDEYAHGVFEVEVTITAGDTTVPNQIGFEASTLTDNPSRTGRISGFAFVSSVRGSIVLDILANPPRRGIEIGRLQMYDGLTSTREIVIYLGRDANNQIGLVIAVLAGGTANGAAITLSTNATVAFLSNDTPVSNVERVTVENNGVVLGEVGTVRTLNFNNNLTAIRVDDEVTINGPNPQGATVYTALSQLPAASTTLTVSSVAYVRIPTTNEVMQFMVVAKNSLNILTWRCISGVSPVLRTVTLPLSATSTGISMFEDNPYVIDARFPYTLIKMTGVPFSGGSAVWAAYYNEGDEYRVRTADLLALDAITHGTILPRNLAQGETIVDARRKAIGLYGGGLGRQSGSAMRLYGFILLVGRTSNHYPLYGLGIELAIRQGTLEAYSQQNVTFTVRGSA